MGRVHRDFPGAAHWQVHLGSEGAALLGRETAGALPLQPSIPSQHVAVHPPACLGVPKLCPWLPCTEGSPGVLTAGAPPSRGGIKPVVCGSSCQLPESLPCFNGSDCMRKALGVARCPACGHPGSLEPRESGQPVLRCEGLQVTVAWTPRGSCAPRALCCLPLAVFVGMLLHSSLAL